MPCSLPFGDAPAASHIFPGDAPPCKYHRFLLKVFHKKKKKELMVFLAAQVNLER